MDRRNTFSIAYLTARTAGVSIYETQFCASNQGYIVLDIHSGYGVQRIFWKESKEKHSENDGSGWVINDFVGKNQSLGKGYAELSPEAMKDYMGSKQTLFINAAITNECGEPLNMPWIVELELPLKV